LAVSKDLTVTFREADGSVGDSFILSVNPDDSHTFLENFFSDALDPPSLGDTEVMNLAGANAGDIVKFTIISPAECGPQRSGFSEPLTCKIPVPDAPWMIFGAAALGLALLRQRLSV
jgi:hypothetical protein